MALTIPVGNLYRLGLSPETSFADPGFQGDFWLMVSNYSGRVVDLKAGDPLARIQFFALSGKPERVHQGAGQVRLPASFPRRPERPDLAGVKVDDNEQVAKLLEDVSNLVDPPHFQHAFITGASRQYAASRINILEHSIRRMRRFVTVVGVLVLGYTIARIIPTLPWFWQYVPEDVKKALAEKFVEYIAVGIIAILAITMLFTRKWIWKKWAKPFLQSLGLWDAPADI